MTTYTQVDYRSVIKDFAQFIIKLNILNGM